MVLRLCYSRQQTGDGTKGRHPKKFLQQQLSPVIHSYNLSVEAEAGAGKLKSSQGNSVRSSLKKQKEGGDGRGDDEGGGDGVGSDGGCSGYGGSGGGGGVKDEGGEGEEELPLKLIDCSSKKTHRLLH